jgi:[calcium/calmodulin-dependent protein kinase] kinase
MKAISKFKGLLARRAAARAAEEAARGGAASPTPEPDAESTAEVAARFVRERQQFLASRNRHGSLAQLLSPAPEGGSATAPLIPPPSPSPRPTVFLGIGTGGIDDFSADPSELPPADVVSDSPTTVDFNVYDRAYEAEVERIKRTSSRRAGRGGGGAGVGGGEDVSIFETKLRERSEGRSPGVGV